MKKNILDIDIRWSNFMDRLKEIGLSVENNVVVDKWSDNTSFKFAIPVYQNQYDILKAERELAYQAINY